MGIGTTSPSPPKPSASAHYPDTNIPHTTYHTHSVLEDIRSSLIGETERSQRSDIQMLTFSKLPRKSQPITLQGRLPAHKLCHQLFNTLFLNMNEQKDHIFGESLHHEKQRPR